MTTSVHPRSPRTAFALAAIAAAVLLLLASPAASAATPGDQAGVFADGSIRYEFIICSTCDKPAGDDFQSSRGGFGSHGPAIVDGFASRGTATATVDARALIVGANALPTLGASASANPGIGTHPGFSGQGAYFFASTASARGIQYYMYTGSTTQTYSMQYTFGGVADSTLSDPQPEDYAHIQVSGGLSLFDDGDKLGGELPMGSLVDISQLAFNGSKGTFHDSATVSITLNPGDAYYLAAFVAANVGFGGYGYADASHTLTVEFTAGDVSQLTPMLLAVPEPASQALMGLGLLATLAALRRRRGAGPQR